MSWPQKPTGADDATNAPMFTAEGLPLDHACFGSALAAAEVGDGGPARRVDCRPPQLLSAPPSILASKTSSADDFQTNSLRVGLNDSSLMDDDDEDELVDYFGSGVGVGAPHASASRALPAVAGGVPTSSRWNVLDRNVPNLPPFYPLERSAVFVPQASASILATRVSAILQARSIAASYDAQNAKVDCVSRSHVEFRIRLYRGNGEFNHGIIIEVQRRAGFNLNYAQDVNAILDAAEGKDTKDQSWGVPPFCPEETKVDEDMNSVENSGGVSSLQIISSILCPKNVNAGGVTVEGRDLAMASLASLTNTERVGQTAVQLSNELLTSETYADLRRVVFCQVQHDQSCTSQRLMLLSLEILANVANSCSQTQSPYELVDLLSQNDHEILSNLIVHIENTVSDPHASDLSCLILRNVFVSQLNVENLIPPGLRARLITALINAVSYGGECHAELHRHSQYCLGLII